MIKLGYFHKKYEELKNLDTPTLRDIQNTKCGCAVRSYIDTILNCLPLFYLPNAEVRDDIF